MNRRPWGPARARLGARVRSAPGAALRAGAWALAALSWPVAADAARVASVSPQGEVPSFTQVQVRFSEAVVPFGDGQAQAPFTLTCNRRAVAGSGRWLDDRSWVFDLAAPSPVGVRCRLEPSAGWAPLSGALDGPREFAFATAAPTIDRVLPWPGSEIEENQHFLLRLNGAVASLDRAHCEIEGLGDRLALRRIEGEVREAILRSQRIPAARASSWLVVACQRPLVPGSRMRLVWGPGVPSAADPAVVSAAPLRWTWDVRPRFTAEFRCERENASSPCLPLRPLALRFSAPVPRALAQAVRLQAAGGAVPARAPALPAGDAADPVQEVVFPAPLPENTRFVVTMPDAMVDDAGRALSNASAFPLSVATGPMPPLAKFAAAPFGIVEHGAQAVVPISLRHVGTESPPTSRLAVRRFDPATVSDPELMRWIGRVAAWHERSVSAREAGLPADQWTVVEREPDAEGRLRDVKRERRIPTRELSLLAGDAAARRQDLPRPPAAAADDGATEVIGVPLPQPGYHVLEVESGRLGRALLGRDAPLYVRTGVLVTQLAVHFKRGRESSLAWVTTLDGALPVAGAKVAVNDCRGRALWSGTTDAQGLARIPRGFDRDEGRASGERAADGGPPPCLVDDGLFVTARATRRPGGSGPPVADLAFVFSDWHRGIERWRFNVPLDDGPQAGLRAHTVFDRTLLRVGDTVSMKHVVRRETAAGLSMPDASNEPDTAVLVHAGSGDRYRVPLTGGPRAWLSQWTVPATARLGLYDVVLEQARPGGDARSHPSGSFRVEAFRVPLALATLAGPRGPLVAPREVALSAQLQHGSGGPMTGQAATLSALLRDREVEFPGYADYRFAPPRQRAARAAAGDDGDDDEPSSSPSADRLVADRLPVRTDAQGAARVVVPALPPLAGPAELVAELSFDDPAGEVQTTTQRLPLWPSAVVVGLRAVPGGRSDAPVSFQAVVLDTDGRPLKDRAVTVQARSHETLSSRQRTVGGFYAWEHRQRTRELGTVCEGRSDAQGLLRCEVRIAHSGEVELVARAADDSGRVAQAAESLWLAGAGEWWFAADDDDRIDLLPEKRELQPGETARIQVRMPYREATALVTVEREGVVDSRVVTLRGRDPVIEVPVPAARRGGATTGGPVQAAATLRTSWAPNVYVSVLVLRRRVRQVPWYSFFEWGWQAPADWWLAWRQVGPEHRPPTAMVDLGKPSYKFGVAELKVGTAAHRLDVAVTPEATVLQPRQVVRVKVAVTHRGRPQPGAEVAFAAVDEGLLALEPNRSWDLLGQMLRPRGWGVETSTAQGEIIGRRHYGRKTLPAGGGGGRNPTRELFDTLLLWQGRVVMDARGQAVVEVPMNDSLTRFRLVAIADDGADRFGTGSAEVRVTQDLQLLPGLPQGVREGDRFDAVVTVRNTTEQPMSVTATLSWSAQARPDAGVTAAAAPPPQVLPAQTVALPAQGAAELRWALDVPEGVQALEVTTAARGQSSAARAAGDRVRTRIAVAPRVPVQVVQAQVLRLGPSPAAAVTLPVALPAASRPAADAGLRIDVRARLSGDLPGVRRYFERYPYTCLEQRVSCSLGLGDAAAWAAVAAELPGHLDADGLAAYFPLTAGSGPAGSDRLSAYLVSAAHDAGQPLPEPVRERLLQGLAAFVEGRTVREAWSPRGPADGIDLAVRKLAAIDALARHGRASPRLLGSIAVQPAAWPTAALIDWYRVLRALPPSPGHAERLAQARSLLRARLAWSGTVLRFTSEDDDFWWWQMDSADGNAARLLLAVMDDPTFRDDLPRLVTGLVGRQRHGAWLTTTANLWGVLALDRFAQRFEAKPVDGRSTVEWGARQRVADWAAAPAGAVVRLPWPPAGEGPMPPLRLSHEAGAAGGGMPWASVQALAAVERTQPVEAGYRIERSLEPVRQAVAGHWSRGDIVRVRLVVQARQDTGWVVIDDPLPAGATVLGSGLGGDSALALRGQRRTGTARLAYEERGAAAWRAYFEHLPGGRHVIEYTVRLNQVGRFGLPPTRVEAMYAPETFGEAPNATLEVQR